jgi:hypothetical protein
MEWVARMVVSARGCRQAGDVASERSSRDNEGGTVKKRSVSDKELLAAHERKIRAWTQFIHTAITSEMQKKQHIDADDCLAIGEALVAVLAVQLTTLATDARMAAEDFANGLRRQVDQMLVHRGN